MDRSGAALYQNRSFRMGMGLLTTMVGLAGLYIYFTVMLRESDPVSPDNALLLTALMGLAAAALEIFVRPLVGLVFAGLTTALALFPASTGKSGPPAAWLLALGVLWGAVILSRTLSRRERDLSFRLNTMLAEVEEEIRGVDSEREKVSLRALQTHEKSGIYRLLEHVAGEINAPQVLEDIRSTVATLTLRSLAVIPEPTSLCVLHLFKGPDREEIISAQSDQAEGRGDAPALLALDDFLSKNKRPFIAADITQEFPGEQAPPAGPYRSVIAVPLVRIEREEDRVRTEVIGVLRMASTQKGGFGVEHLRILSTLGDLAGAVVTNCLLYQVTQKEATTDSLTGLYVQRYFRERFEDEVRRAGRLGKPLSFLMCDIDHFKTYNDTYGHAVGDLVLRAISRQLRDCTRNVDFLARYGGEEFAVVLPETETAGAARVAERIRERVKTTRIAIVEEETAVTISIGVATFPTHGSTAEEILEKADQALYKAKDGGRNRVVIYEEGAT